MDIKKILESLVPFVVIGVAIALCIGLLFMFFSIAMWGLIIGGILWLATLAKQYLFPSKSSTTPTPTKDEGRIIEHDDHK
jgi:small neutral amino acid transporter SnatA (MarC family)